MEQTAQVSIEYLLTVLFAVILVMAAWILLDTIRITSQMAKARILDNREKTIAAVLE